MADKEKICEIFFLFVCVILLSIWKMIEYVMSKIKKVSRCIYRKQDNIFVGIFITFLFLGELFYLFFFQYDINYGQISEEAKQETNKKSK